MAEKVISYRVEIKANEASRKKLIGLQTEFDKSRIALKKLNKAEKDGIISTTRASKARAGLTTKLHANRNALNDHRAAILKNNNALRKNSGFVAGVSKGMASFATSMLGPIAAIAILSRGIGAAFNIVKDFEQGQADLASVLGVSVSGIQELTSNAKALGATTVFTASQVLELSKEYAKLGFSKNEILGVTKATLDLAAATGTDLARSAEVVGSTIRAFNLSAEDSQRVVDVMAKSFSTSALDMEKFATAMGNVAPVAKNAGLSIEETTAKLGVLVDRGIDASTAGTGLRNVFLELTKKGLSFDEAMTMINESTNKSKTSLELFGKRGAVVGTILAETGDQAAILTEKLNDAGGAAKKMADTQLNTLTGKTKLMTSAWEGLILGIESGSGIFSKVLGTAIELATKLFSVLAGGKRDVAAVRQEQESFNSTFNTSIDILKDANVPLFARKEIIDKLNETYGDYLPNLITEETSLTELIELQKQFNHQAKIRLTLAVNQVAIQNAQEEATEKLRLISALRMNDISQLSYLDQLYYSDVFNNETLRQIALVKTEKSYLDLQNAIGNLTNANDTYTRSVEKGGIFQKALLAGVITDVNDASDETIKTTKKTDTEKRKTVKAFSSFFKEALESEAKEEDYWSRDSVKRSNEEFEFQKGLLNDSVDLAKKELEVKAVNEKVANDVFLSLELSRLQAELELNKIFGKDTVDIERDILDKKHELRLEAADVKKEDDEISRGDDQIGRDIQLQADLAAIDVLSKAYSAFIQIKRDEQDRETERYLTSITDKSDTEIKILQNRLDKGLISEDEFAIQKLAIDKKREKDELAIKKQAFEKKRKLDQALITFELAKELASIAAAAAANPANAVTLGGAGIAQYGILAAVALANFAINTAAIQSAQFAKGGILEGNSHAQGGIQTPFGEMEGGEAVINKASTQKYRGLLSAINESEGGVAFRGAFSPVRYMAGGGILGRPTPSSADIGSGSEISRIFELMAQQTSNIISTIRVQNVVTDTSSVLDQVIDVENQVTLG